MIFKFQINLLAPELYWIERLQLTVQSWTHVWSYPVTDSGEGGAGRRRLQQNQQLLADTLTVHSSPLMAVVNPFK